MKLRAYGRSAVMACLLAVLLALSLTGCGSNGGSGSGGRSGESGATPGAVWEGLFGIGDESGQIAGGTEQDGGDAFDQGVEDAEDDEDQGEVDDADYDEDDEFYFGPGTDEFMERDIEIAIQVINYINDKDEGAVRAMFRSDLQGLKEPHQMYLRTIEWLQGTTTSPNWGALTEIEWVSLENDQVYNSYRGNTYYTDYNSDGSDYGVFGGGRRVEIQVRYNYEYRTDVLDYQVVFDVDGNLVNVKSRW